MNDGYASKSCQNCTRLHRRPCLPLNEYTPKKVVGDTSNQSCRKCLKKGEKSPKKNVAAKNCPQRTSYDYKKVFHLRVHTLNLIL